MPTPTRARCALPTVRTRCTATRSARWSSSAMKALLCRELAGVGALRVEEVADPEPQAGEVRVAVHAAGVNFPDVLLVQGKYQYKAPLPFAPGFELAGTVEKVGAGVAHVQAGDLVLAIVPHG